MRSDRRFCGEQCRLWWYRHRSKRADFPPGGDRYPVVRKRGRRALRKSPVEALQAARAELARRKTEARQQQTLENHLRNHLMQVTLALTEARAQALREQDALRDELDALRSDRDAEKQRAEEALQQAESTAVQTQAQKGELAELMQRLQEAEQAATERLELQCERDQLKRERDELTERREKAERERDELTEQREKAERERDELTEQREKAERERAEAVQGHDELRGRLDGVQRQLVLRDEELKQHRQRFAAVERAHQEVHVVAESESRSLRAEKERRSAAERRIEQLTLDLERLAAASQLAGDFDAPPVHLLRADHLTAELAEVRRHRDDAIAERELLSARILKLMAPGQYLEHAAAAGYDLTRDPLIRLKREEVLVESRLALWQEAHGKRRRARRLDPEQTLDEQAYAAALSFRWKQIDHPHRRRKQPPKWVSIGFLLDTESERYLLTLTEERIAGMKQKIEAAR